MLTPRRVLTPLSYRKGTAKGFGWPITSGGAPVSLTGWSVRAQIREFPGAAEVLHEMTTEDGSASVADSRVALWIKPADSADWSWRDAVYDVLLTDPDGAVMTVAEGSFTLRQGVTIA